MTTPKDDDAPVGKHGPYGSHTATDGSPVPSPATTTGICLWCGEKPRAVTSDLYCAECDAAKSRPASAAPAPPREGLYIASKTRHAARWRELRATGVPVICTWIDEAGEGETVDWAALWDRCIAEARSAKALVLYAEDGEALRGAYVEMGAALGAGVPVYLATPPDFCTAARHRGVTWCASVDAAISAALEAA